MKLQFSYYLNKDVIFLAKDLLGKVILTEINGEVTAGIIVETEAYFGTQGKASHAYGGRRTNHSLLPWRFFVKGNKYVSKPNKV